MDIPNKCEQESPKRARKTSTKAFKSEFVAHANSGSISLSQLAIDHRINTNQLRKIIAEAKQKFLACDTARQHAG